MKLVIGVAAMISVFAATIVTGFSPAVAQPAAHTEIRQVVIELERELGARIGLSVRDGASGREWSYRGDERFALTSTFKAFACAGLLSRVAAGQDSLSRRVAFSRAAIVSHSPVTAQFADREGLTLGELCAATLKTSDNTAANLVLDAIGGPTGFSAFMRGMGDSQTRVDRRETVLNQATPGDPRDTTSPSAATSSLRHFVLGEGLSTNHREQLTQWMADNAVAGPLLRQSLPVGWRIADRTGAGGHGARGIIATIWPQQGTPQVVAVYMAETTASMDERNRAISRIGAAIFASNGKM